MSKMAKIIVLSPKGCTTVSKFIRDKQPGKNFHFKPKMLVNSFEIHIIDTKVIRNK